MVTAKAVSRQAPAASSDGRGAPSDLRSTGKPRRHGCRTLRSRPNLREGEREPPPPSAGLRTRRCLLPLDGDGAHRTCLTLIDHDAMGTVSILTHTSLLGGAG